ncbi:MAG: hypothetical protein IKB09_09740 [Oscillospiraceae bacterium]|nr:hypothetical protein [Oscillospiraceae bacterium]MBR6595162.1 hypothetical protein [Oscillospiraceae bacterium]
MIEIKTNTGFRCQLPEDAVNDMELVELMAAEMPEAYRIAKVAAHLLGEQKKTLYEHVRTDGRVPVDAVEREIRDILLALGNKGKNS